MEKHLIHVVGAHIAKSVFTIKQNPLNISYFSRLIKCELFKCVGQDR